MVFGSLRFVETEVGSGVGEHWNKEKQILEWERT
jgi:hypothetical protein